jgi:hypothetical protein
MMDAFNDNQSGKPRSFAIRPLYAFTTLTLIVVLGAIGWSTFVTPSHTSHEAPAKAFAPPPIVPPTMPLYRPAIAEIRDELREMRTETVSGFDTVRSEQRAMRTDLGTELREMRTAQRSDFRWLLGIMLGGFVALLGALGGAMAHGFGWL